MLRHSRHFCLEQMSGLDEGSLSFLITLVDTFVFSSLIMKIRKRDACLSVFLLSSLFCHKCQPSLSLARETIVFLNALRNRIQWGIHSFIFLLVFASYLEFIFLMEDPYKKTIEFLGNMVNALIEIM